ncbi:glutamate formimidoyltransferase [candidate division WOR-3 bacterium]|nr:glutamate formimidoyltransferase [candidate division WOR-3 bacterium]
MKLVECVPNFSEGQDEKKINLIVDEIKNTSGVWLLDVDPGADTNRTVVTFVGSPDAVSEAAFRAIKKASLVIDMREHKGEHPRMGATDVCPFVPVRDVSMEKCIEIAKKLGARVAEELKIPIYLYEEAATEEQRKNLANIRKGEYEGFPLKIKEPEWKPDYGEPVFNEKAGVTAIGAREFLIAYNVNLNTRDKKLAHKIALNVRESGRIKKDKDGNVVKDENGVALRIPGKLKATKAIGWYVDEYGLAQISINLTNYKITSPHEAFEEIRKEARDLGLRVTGSELVGLIPKDALVEAGKYYLEKQGKSRGVSEREIIHYAAKSLGLNDITEFNTDDKVIEYRINKEIDRLTDLSLTEFADELSSDSPAPGGGSVAAFCGSLSASLIAMVGNLTFGKNKYKEHWEEAEKIAGESQGLKCEFLDLCDEDTEAFNQLMKAFRMKKNTEEEQREREEMIQVATKRATEVPLKVMRKALLAIELALKMGRIGNVNAISDVGVASEMAVSACKSASLNIKINLPSIKDEEFAREVSGEHDEILKKIGDIQEEVGKVVLEKLKD